LVCAFSKILFKFTNLGKKIPASVLVEVETRAALADLSALAETLVVVPQFDLVFGVALEFVVVVGALAPAGAFVILLQSVAVLQIVEIIK